MAVKWLFVLLLLQATLRDCGLWRQSE